MWKKAVCRFLFYTLGLSALLTVPRVLIHPRRLTRAAVSCAAMWVPALGAWLAMRRYPETSLRYGLKRCPIWYLLAAMLIPVWYLGASYAVCFAQLPALKLTVGLAGQIGLELLRAMGEEIGWRGFLYPALERLYGLRRSLLFGGLVWAIWHYPLILGKLYLTGTPLWWSLPVFTVEIISMGVILAWLCRRSGSLLPAVVLHATHNFLLLLLAGSRSGSAYFFGEQGAVTAALTAGTAGVFLLLQGDSGVLSRGKHGRPTGN